MSRFRQLNLANQGTLFREQLELHLEIVADGLADIGEGLRLSLTLGMAARQGRAAHRPSTLGRIQRNLVFHGFSKTPAGAAVKPWTQPNTD